MGSDSIDKLHPGICAQVNGALEVREVVKYLGWYPHKLVRTGEVLLGLCPIHRDTVFRTLVLNPRNNTYHCKHVGCPGNRPADLLDLVALAKGKPLAEVIEELINHFGEEYIRLTDRNLEIVRRMASESRNARAGDQTAEDLPGS